MLSGIVYANGVSEIEANCSVYNEPEEVGPISEVSVGAAGTDLEIEEDVPVTGYVVLTAPGLITLGCTSGDSVLAGYGSSLTAIAVGAIN
jgi:hypothetical protein